MAKTNDDIHVNKKYRDTGVGEYEWTATMININSGKNRSVMDSCHVLYLIHEI